MVKIITLFILSVFSFSFDGHASPLDCYSVFSQNLTGFHRIPSLSKSATHTSLDALRRFRNSRLGISQSDVEDFPVAIVRHLKASNESDPHKKAQVYSQVSGILDHAAKPETNKIDTEIQTLGTTFRGKEDILKFIGEFEKTRKFFNRKFYTDMRLFFKGHLPLASIFDLVFISYFFYVLKLGFIDGNGLYILQAMFWDIFGMPLSLIEYVRDDLSSGGMTQFMRRTQHRLRKEDLQNSDWEFYSETRRFERKKTDEMLYSDQDISNLDSNIHRILNTRHVSFFGRLLLDFLVDRLKAHERYPYGISDVVFFVDPTTGEPCLTVVSRLTKERPPSPKKRPLKNLVPKFERPLLPVSIRIGG